MAVPEVMSMAHLFLEVRLTTSRAYKGSSPWAMSTSLRSFFRSLERTYSISINRSTLNYRCYSAGAAGSKDYGNIPEFSTRWTKFFADEAYDQFELLRGLNNCFSYDIVPPLPVVEAALRAARRLNDFATAVRVFGGIKEKVENKMQYETYMEHLADLKAELGVPTPEELGRE